MTSISQQVIHSNGVLVEIDGTFWEGPLLFSSDDLTQIDEVWNEASNSDDVLQAQDMRRWTERAELHRAMSLEDALLALFGLKPVRD
jgi:hypothetical protein